MLSWKRRLPRSPVRGWRRWSELSRCGQSTSLDECFFCSTLPKQRISLFVAERCAGDRLLDMAANIGVGFSKFVSLGNKAVLDESALLSYFASDKNVGHSDICRGLAPSGGDTTKRRAMAQTKRPKPIIILKSGRRRRVRRRSSHRGRLQANDASYEALFEESGILRAETAEELFLLARVLALTAPSGKSCCDKTNAGGPGVFLD